MMQLNPKAKILHWINTMNTLQQDSSTS